jgi:Cu2+-exporting ATPase
VIEPNTSTNTCKHCSNKTIGNEQFCCFGCETAYNIINNLGLSFYYKSRSNSASKPEQDLKEINMENFVIQNKNANGGNSNQLYLVVEGLHCPSCVWLIENALMKQDNVTYARLNLSTKRLEVKWNGDKKLGNDLVILIERMGYKLMPYDPQTLKTLDNKYEKFLLWCLAISGFATGNLMLFSFALWSYDVDQMGLATRSLIYWVSALIALPTIIFSGLPFYRSAISALKAKKTNMDVPISVGIIVTTLMSLHETIIVGEHIYFDSAVMLIFFLLIGRYLDIKARGKARQAASDLLQMMNGAARVLVDGKIEIIPAAQLKENMVLMVASGEKIYADGIVTNGESEVDLSIITGETLPQKIQKNDNVFAGSLNLNSPIEVLITKPSENSLISEIIKLMEKAEQSQAKYVAMADKIAKLYTPVVHILAAFTLIFWGFLSSIGWHASILNAVAVLIITCPCALGLAVPIVQVIASGKLMKRGIFLKSGSALERIAEIDLAIFDKTGTLTKGHLELVNANEINADLFQLAASLAVKSNHPLSKALSKAYNGTLLQIDAEEIKGAGLHAVYNGKNIKLGNANFCTIEQVSNDEFIEIWLVIEGQAPTRFKFADELKDDALEIISRLKAQNIEVVILSGDRQNIVEKIAKELGVATFFAQTSPIEKTKIIADYKAKSKKVLMVGDGLNDAAAVASAHVSMSPSSAIDITQNSADLVFQGNKLAPIFDALNVAKFSDKLVKQNFAISLVYNIVAIPLAFMGYINPIGAAIAMSASSIMVIFNSLRLNLKK